MDKASACEPEGRGFKPALRECFIVFDPKKIPFSLFDLATFRVDSEKHADTSDAPTVARRIKIVFRNAICEIY